MKMEKLDSKQVPQVIGIGVVSVVIFGWAAFTFLGSMGPAASQNTTASAKPAAKGEDGKARVQEAQNKVTTGEVAAATGAPAAGAPGAVGVPGTPANAETGAPLPGMPGAAPMGNQYNPDPFKSPFPTKDPSAPKPAPKSPIAKATATAGAVDRNTPALPDLGMRPQWTTPAPGAGAAPAPAVVPAPPARPDVVVTGVVAGDGMREMAMLKTGNEERILQVGDRVNDATSYKVRKIASDGVVLAQGKDSFFVALGAKTPVAKVEAK